MRRGWEATLGKMNRRTLSPKLEGGGSGLSFCSRGGQFMISHLTESTEFQEILEEGFREKNKFYFTLK